MEPDIKPMASPSPLPLSRLATRVAYASTQLPRIAWYAGHFQIMRRLAQEVRRRNGEVTPSKPPADASREANLEQRLDADRRALFAQDIANVEAGIYPLPADHDGSLLTLLDRSRLFFATCRTSTRAASATPLTKSSMPRRAAAAPTTTCRISISSRAAG